MENSNGLNGERVFGYVKSAVGKAIDKIQNKQEARPGQVRISGTYNYEFSLKRQQDKADMASNLVIEALEPGTKQHIPLRCEWTRIKQDRAYILEGVTGNAYQLSADDIGCTIRVKAQPLEIGFEGTA